MPALTRHPDHPEVFLLDLGSDENRFSPGWMTAVTAALTEVADTAEPRALVTVASGKTWSQGLDLAWLQANPDELNDYVHAVHALLATVLVLPVPTVAAVQGHAFAAGAMLALAHDQRVMRAERGYFCLPEVDIAIPFTDGMTALITSKLAQPTVHEVMTTGTRYGGELAAERGIVAAAVTEQELLGAAVARALPLAAKSGATLGTIKRGLYACALATLMNPATDRPAH